MCRPASEGGRRCAAHQGQQRRDADRERYYRKTTGERAQIINGMIPASRAAGISNAQMHEVIFEKPSPKGLTDQQLTDAIAAVEWAAPDVTKIRHRLADLLFEMTWRVKHKARTIAWVLEANLGVKLTAAVAETQPLTREQVGQLAADPVPTMREALARNENAEITGEQRSAQLRDDHPGVRYAAANKLTDAREIEHLAEKGELHVQRGIAANPHTPTRVLEQMANRQFETDSDGNEIHTGNFDLVRNSAAHALVTRGVRDAGRQHARPERDLAGNKRKSVG